MIDKFKNRWEVMTPKQKQTTIFGSVIGLLIVVVLLSSEDRKAKPQARLENEVEFISDDATSVNFEQYVGKTDLLADKVNNLSSNYNELKTMIQNLQRTISLNEDLTETPQILYDMKRQVEDLKKHQIYVEGVLQSGVDNKHDELDNSIDFLESEKEPNSVKTPETPIPATVKQVIDNRSRKVDVIPDNPLAYLEDAYGEGQPNHNRSSEFDLEGDDESNKQQPSQRNKIEIVQNESINDEQGQSDKKTKWKGSILPAGSLIPGLVISGVDAPTGKAAEKGAVASTMRITGPAILPNGHRVDLEGCFVTFNVRGDQATSRAYFRPINLTCQLEAGIVDTKIKGYVTGKDGNQGFRGRLINKQGDALMYAAGAGIIGGFGNAFSGGSGGNRIVAGGQFELPTMEEAMTAGIGQGVNEASKVLSEYYKEQLDLLHPVIEIKPMIFGSIHLLQTVELKLFNAN